MDRKRQHCWKLDLNSYDPDTKQESNNFVTNLITKLIISAYLSMCFNTAAFLETNVDRVTVNNIIENSWK